MLDGGPGPKNVYFKVRNVHGESGPIFDSITYILPPSGLSILINGGAVETGSAIVTLTLIAIGATQMCFSNDGVTWSAWEPFATNKVWEVSDGAGIKTVYFKVRNGNGTIESTEITADTISYDPLAGIRPAIIIMASIGAGIGLFLLYRRYKKRKSSLK